MTAVKIDTKAGATAKVSPGCFLLFALPFLAAGAFTLWIFGQHFLGYWRAGSWQRTPATIESVALLETPGAKGGVHCTVRAAYRYEYGGRSYAGTRVAADEEDTSNWRQRERVLILEHHRASGEPFPAWVNPRDPAESLLFREMLAASWTLAPVGLLIAGIGVFILAVGIRAGRAERRRALLLAEHPGRPWRADGRWRRGFVFGENRSMAWWAAGGAIFLAFAATAGWTLLVRDAPWPVLAVLGLFGLIGVGLLVMAAHGALRAAKYGAPRLALTEMPAAPGRTLVAIVLCRKHVAAESAFRVTLKCERTTARDGDTPRRVETLHESTVEVQRDQNLAAEREGTAIPVELPIPAELPETSAPGADPGVKWTLTVAAATPGVAFSAEFDLPVFRVDNEALIERRPARE
jgi:hypothetical protein